MAPHQWLVKATFPFKRPITSAAAMNLLSLQVRPSVCVLFSPCKFHQKSGVKPIYVPKTKARRRHVLQHATSRLRRVSLRPLSILKLVSDLRVCNILHARMAGAASVLRLVLLFPHKNAALTWIQDQDCPSSSYPYRKKIASIPRTWMNMITIPKNRNSHAFSMRS